MCNAQNGLGSPTEPQPVDTDTQCDTWTIQAAGPELLQVQVFVGGVPLMMELNTDASLSIIGDYKFRIIFPEAQLEHSDVNLKSYLGRSSAVLGKIAAVAKLGSGEAKLPLFVMKGPYQTLLWRY